MEELKFKWLQYSYPMMLWLLVAFFTLLACKNVVGSAEWESGQPNLIQSEFPTAVVETIPALDPLTPMESPLFAASGRL